MKTPLARALRFFARRSAHTAPCFTFPLPPVPSLPRARRAERKRAAYPCCARAGTGGLLAPRNSGGSAAPEGRPVRARYRARVAPVRKVPRPVATG